MVFTLGPRGPGSGGRPGGRLVAAGLVVRGAQPRDDIHRELPGDLTQVQGRTHQLNMVPALALKVFRVVRGGKSQSGGGGQQACDRRKGGGVGM